MSIKNIDKDSLLAEVLDIVRIVLICFVCVFVSTRFLFKPVRVDGSSMYPTLEDGEFGFSNVFSVLMNDFDRFDVVVVSGEATEGSNWVKRIIAMPNETIEYREDKLYINGKYVEEPFLDEEYIHSQTLGQQYFTNDFGPVKLGKDEYFLMGDNRMISHDSRAVGTFKENEMVSKSVGVVYPLDKMGIVNDGTK